ncbi:hypothetical protein RBB68_01595 [Leptospira interrogans]|uniref:Uncharacterized protein n=2 Tax=Leptospira interrogans TaxID=173 RepID=A0AAQ0AVW5_LEPIR|nr:MULTISPECIES: hypothetical protein [Leptospira]AKH75876.1 hypothetical protein BRAT_01575 [Leptospira interrogans serovar Bratislava]AKP27321.1 hypothetical protein LIMLP_16230 [Leptospira interrogans serovar Manilae]AKP31091.1 hypothetical protein LIMHP_16220 [Leptospira interrogans serovar Manilae]ALN99052.1 hypothetical protein LIH_01610 [Leptospira interrogans serovar Hardjo-prajitno]EYU64826.1 hypothetical protein CI00_04525 [Leptospira interrogans serovar Manilae]
MMPTERRLNKAVKNSWSTINKIELLVRVKKKRKKINFSTTLMQKMVLSNLSSNGRFSGKFKFVISYVRQNLIL